MRTIFTIACGLVLLSGLIAACTSISSTTTSGVKRIECDGCAGTFMKTVCSPLSYGAGPLPTPVTDAFKFKFDVYTPTTGNVTVSIYGNLVCSSKTWNVGHVGIPTTLSAQAKAALTNSCNSNAWMCEPASECARIKGTTVSPPNVRFYVDDSSAVNQHYLCFGNSGMYITASKPGINDCWWFVLNA